MFIHLGGDRMIKTNDLIAIFDLSIEKSSKTTQQYINSVHLTKNIEIISQDDSKSIVVTSSKVYYSPISSSTIRKRINQLVND